MTTCILSLVLAWLFPDAGLLSGRVVDAVDGRPVAGARVEVIGLERGTLTDRDGGYRIEVPPGAWRLAVSAAGYAPGELANQVSGAESAPAHLFPLELRLEAGQAPLFGLGPGTGAGPEPHGPASLGRLAVLARVPAQLPATIRVARYFTTGCSGAYQRIDEIDFEDYVRGVVNAEVGVFRGVAGGPDAAAECWKAFAVAARSYALHFILTQPYSGYDINDTACNQVYKDDRTAEVSAAVDATRGMILVKAADHDTIDRYFYAASCVEHGTEPAYAAGAIIPDRTAARACVGTWCAHDSCAGHADNPQVPGDDKCLVWGTCQWGAVERSMAGESFRDILAHYQPNCAVRQLGTPSRGTLTGVVYRAPDLQDWIAGAEVTLQGGPTVTFDGRNPWSFELDPGTYTVGATAAGFLPGSVERTVNAGETTWGSIGLYPAGDGGPDGADAGADASGDGGGVEEDASADGVSGDDGGQDGDGSKGGGCGCSHDGNRSASSLSLLFLLILRRKRAFGIGIRG